MQNYDLALVLVQLALPRAAGVITIESCLDVNAFRGNQINFPYTDMKPVPFLPTAMSTA